MTHLSTMRTTQRIINLLHKLDNLASSHSSIDRLRKGFSWRRGIKACRLPLYFSHPERHTDRGKVKSYEPVSMIMKQFLLLIIKLSFRTKKK